MSATSNFNNYILDNFFRVFTLSLLTVISLFYLSPPAHAALDLVIEGQVVKVTDGDTIVVRDSQSQREHKIRLLHIDAPESRQEYGAESTAALKKRIAGKHVTVEYSQLDRYKRVLGVVKQRDDNINHWMVANGHAWHYKQYSSSRAFSLAESGAKQSQSGLWRSATPTPPWEWRKAHK
ncbi:MAG: thermonuclease family protein [Thiotrichales bacterium]|nr:thermonuclease family protein [Thiotrichales bacterium]